MRKMWIAAVGLGVLLGCLFIPVRGRARSAEGAATPPGGTALAPNPSRPLNLLFIHHSVGGQLLADPGEGPGKNARGGGLRRLLEGANYRVHTATYGSPLGEHTDLFDWQPKFHGEMDAVLTTDNGKDPLPDGARHDVVMFKSCYPNNYFLDAGKAPGNPKGPKLTVENAKAALSSLLPEFQKQPKTLFVYLTAPPVAPQTWPEPVWKWIVKAPLDKTATAKLERQSKLARDFNDWVQKEWLKDYPLENVAVIDYYDLLTNYGASNLLVYPSGGGSDSHPSSEGQTKAAPVVLQALNRAVQAAGL